MCQFSRRVDGQAGSAGEELARPWRQELLDAHCAFVLHWKQQQLWVWSGNRVPLPLKEAALRLAASLQQSDTNIPVSGVNSSRASSASSL